ncbi:hypothetical protein HYX16_05740 [Candidatus Woesearchaeota archaeon]|nr:hypothetical protein [Candidatus Woesearchaeota archaeon]
MDISRRRFLGIAASAVTLTALSPLELLAQEKEKIISDPEILKFYEGLIEKLKKRELDFYSQETFFSFVDVLLEVKNYIDENNLGRNGIFNLEDLPKDLKKRLDEASERHKLAVARPDLFEDIPFLETFIEKNTIPKHEIIDKINKNDVVLFGESDDDLNCWTMELMLLHNVLGNFAYADEGFQIYNEQHIKRYLEEGRNFSLELAVEGMESDGIAHPLNKKVKDFLSELRKLGTPVIPTDVWVDLQKNISSRFDRDNLISQLYSIREQVFARQISYAVKKGYKVLGSFGDLHLRSHALPKHLAKSGVSPLVISTGDFPLEVYEAAMRVSKRKDIFFRRNSKIIYMTKHKEEDLKRFILPTEVWKKYDHP